VTHNAQQLELSVFTMAVAAIKALHTQINVKTSRSRTGVIEPLTLLACTACFKCFPVVHVVEAYDHDEII
jgi:hypothetical protein